MMKRYKVLKECILDHVFYGVGDIFAAGAFSCYWSCTANSNPTIAYYLYCCSSSVYPSDHYNRFFGFSLRFVRDRRG